jgi:hypothetical protein
MEKRMTCGRVGKIFLCLCIIVIFALLSPPSQAQLPCTIVGMVYYVNNGSAAPNASVSINNTNTGEMWYTETWPDGSWSYDANCTAGHIIKLNSSLPNTSSSKYWFNNTSFTVPGTGSPYTPPDVPDMYLRPTLEVLNFTNSTCTLLNASISMRSYYCGYIKNNWDKDFSGVYLGWSAPFGWEFKSEFSSCPTENCSIGTLSAGQISWNNVTYDVNSSATVGPNVTWLNGTGIDLFSNGLNVNNFTNVWVSRDVFFAEMFGPDTVTRGDTNVNFSAYVQAGKNSTNNTSIVWTFPVGWVINVSGTNIATISTGNLTAYSQNWSRISVTITGSAGMSGRVAFINTSGNYRNNTTFAWINVTSNDSLDVYVKAWGSNVYITSCPSEVIYYSASSATYTFSSYVENNGTETLTNAYLNWSIPSGSGGWTIVTGSENKSIGSFSGNTSQSNTLTITIPDTATIQTVTVWTNSTNNESINRNTSCSVSVAPSGVVVEILEYPLIPPDYIGRGSKFKMKARIFNGNATTTLTNVWLNWSLPGWNVTYGSLNSSIGSLAPQAEAFSEIMVYVPLNAPTSTGNTTMVNVTGTWSPVTASNGTRNQSVTVGVYDLIKVYFTWSGTNAARWGASYLPGDNAALKCKVEDAVNSSRVYPNYNVDFDRQASDGSDAYSDLTVDATDSSGIADATWTLTAANYGTMARWAQCKLSSPPSTAKAVQDADSLKIYILTNKPVVFLRGRSYYTWTGSTYGTSESDNNPTAANDGDGADHDEKGKKWVTIQMGEATAQSRNHVPAGCSGANCLANTYLLGCSDETTCAYRKVNENYGVSNNLNYRFRVLRVSQTVNSTPAGYDDIKYGTTESGSNTCAPSHAGDTSLYGIINIPYFDVPDCELMRGRKTNFFFEAGSFTGGGTASNKDFWLMIGLWLDDKHVVVFGQNSLHYMKMIDTANVIATVGSEQYFATTIDGCTSIDSCSSEKDFGTWVKNSIVNWRELWALLAEDLGNFSKTYPSDSSQYSISELARQFLKSFGEPASPHYQGVSHQGAAQGHTDNDAGFFENWRIMNAAGAQTWHDPHAVYTEVNVTFICSPCHIASGTGDTRPAARDFGALQIGAISYLIEDMRDRWQIRLNNATVRAELESWFDQWGKDYAKITGPPNGTNGFTYFLKGLVNADPKAWADFSSSYYEGARDGYALFTVLRNEQFGRAWTPNLGNAASSDATNASNNNQSAIKFITAILQMVTYGIQQYSLQQSYVLERNPDYLKQNSIAKWGFPYWFLKLGSTWMDYTDYSKLESYLQEKARYIAYGNYGTAFGYGTVKASGDNCKNILYHRSWNTNSYTTNDNHPDRDRWGDIIGVDPGDPAGGLNDSGWASNESGYNYIYCRLQYAPQEDIKNLADALVEALSVFYRGGTAMMRYGADAIPPIGEEPTVADFSTAMFDFLEKYLNVTKVRTVELMYTPIVKEQIDQYGYTGNNDDPYKCNQFTDSTGILRCRNRYFSEKIEANYWLYKFALRLLQNIDFGSSGAFYNLTKLRVERAADWIGPPSGTEYGLSYSLNYGRNILNSVRTRFAETTANALVLYIRTYFDMKERQDSVLTYDQKLRYAQAIDNIKVFVMRWFSEWADLLVNIQGLSASYYQDTSDTAGGFTTLAASTTDDTINFDWEDGYPTQVENDNYFSIHWKGKLTAPSNGTYTFYMCYDDSATLKIDGQAVTLSGGSGASSCTNPPSGDVNLGAGKHDISVDYYEADNIAYVELFWKPPLASAREIIPKEAFSPGYMEDYGYNMGGFFLYMLSTLNTLYGSFSDSQLNRISDALAQNLTRYFGDIQGTSGKAGDMNLSMRMADLPRRQFYTEEFRFLRYFAGPIFGHAALKLPESLPDLSTVSEEGIKFVTNIADLANRVLWNIEQLPDAKRTMTYDRYNAYSYWSAKSFRNSTEAMFGPSIVLAGAEFADHFGDLLGAPNATTGLNYLHTYIQAVPERWMRPFADELWPLIKNYTRFYGRALERFPAVVTPSMMADYMQEKQYKTDKWWQTYRSIGESIVDIQGLRGEYYQNVFNGSLYVAYDDGIQCNVSNINGNFPVINKLTESHGAYTNYDNDDSRWDAKNMTIDAALAADENVLNCRIKDTGGDTAFDAELKVGSRVRIPRSDDDANYFPSFSYQGSSVPPAGTSEWKATKDVACADNPTYKYYACGGVNCGPSGNWWELTYTETGWTTTSNNGPLGAASTANTGNGWNCNQNNMLATSGGERDLYIRKKFNISRSEDATLKLVRTDPTINFNWSTGSPDSSIDPDYFYVKWTGKLNVPSSVTVQFCVGSNDGLRLKIDGRNILEYWNLRTDYAENCTRNADGVGDANQGSSPSLPSGLHDIQLEYFENNGTANVSLRWNDTSAAASFTGRTKQIINKTYLYTKDPEVLNSSARGFEGAVYGWTGTINYVYIFSSYSLIRASADEIAAQYPYIFGSYGGVNGRNYETRNSLGLRALRDEYVNHSVNLLRSVIKFLKILGEQGSSAIPPQYINGFVRLWDTSITSMSTAMNQTLYNVSTYNLTGSASKVVYNDSSYATGWITGAAVNQTATYLAAQGFTAMNASQLRTWMSQSGDRSDTVAVIAQDVCPDVVCDVPLPNGVVYYDNRYPGNWINTAEGAIIRDYLVNNGSGSFAFDSSRYQFVEKDADRVKTWIDTLLSQKKAPNTVLVMAKDVCPATICEGMSINATIIRYLREGGRVVWMGDIPFYYQGLIDGDYLNRTWNWTGMKTMLGVKSDGENDGTMLGRNDLVTITADGDNSGTGMNWGLTQTWRSARPVDYRLVPDYFNAEFHDDATWTNLKMTVQQGGTSGMFAWECPPSNSDCNPSYAGTDYTYPIYFGVSSPARDKTTSSPTWIDDNTWSIRYTGKIYIPLNGTYTFTLSNVDDSASVYVTGVCSPCASGTGYSFTKGFYDFRLDYSENTGRAEYMLKWNGPSGSGIVNQGVNSKRAETEMTVLAKNSQSGTGPVTNISAFQKNFLPSLPDSGFVRIWDYDPTTTDLTATNLLDLYNVASHNLTINVAGNDSVIKQYMIRGGRVVWMGDIPFYYSGHVYGRGSRNNTQWGEAGQRELLGVEMAGYGSSTASLTGEGTTWGMLYAGSSSRATDAQYVTYVLATNGSENNASAWTKDFDTDIVNYVGRIGKSLRYGFNFSKIYMDSLLSAPNLNEIINSTWAYRYWSLVNNVDRMNSALRNTQMVQDFANDTAASWSSTFGTNEHVGFSYIMSSSTKVDTVSIWRPMLNELLDFLKSYYAMDATYWTNFSNIMRSTKFIDRFGEGGTISNRWDMPTPTATWGTWSIVNGMWRQSDTAPTNTRSSTKVNQTGMMVFEWNATFNSANRRAGMFFFSNNCGLTNRDYSYFVRQNDDSIEIWKSVADSLGGPYATYYASAANGDTHYYKVAYDRSNGGIYVYRNGTYIGKWVDPSPLTNGSCISLYTSASDVSFDNIEAAPARWDPPINGTTKTYTTTGCTNYVLDSCIISPTTPCTGTYTIDSVQANDTVFRPQDDITATITCSSGNRTISYNTQNGTGWSVKLGPTNCAGTDNAYFALWGNPGVHRIRGSIVPTGPFPLPYTCGTSNADNDDLDIWVAEPIKG